MRVETGMGPAKHWAEGVCTGSEVAGTPWPWGGKKPFWLELRDGGRPQRGVRGVLEHQGGPHRASAVE